MSWGDATVGVCVLYSAPYPQGGVAFQNPQARGLAPSPWRTRLMAALGLATPHEQVLAAEALLQTFVGTTCLLVLLREYLPFEYPLFRISLRCQTRRPTSSTPSPLHQASPVP